ncbi:MAG TPA: GntR family transcriptional regulator [Streptosporangiaceae bacterium]|nr:GntR family transcriptional regulator [Streptosporangiaceae bacterium]
MATPKYRVIANDLRSKIESGELERGSQLLTESVLQKRYDASRNTVRDAVKWLINLGLVQTRPGQGTFVVEEISPFSTALTGIPVLPEELEAGLGGERDAYAAEVSAQGRNPDQQDPTVEIQKAAGVAAQELQLVGESFVVVRHQRRFIDGAPYSLQTTFYPMHLVEDGATALIQAQDMPSGAVRYLEKKLGVKQAGWIDRITVRPPDQNEAEFFGLAEDGRIAVFETFRTGYDDSLRPLRLTVTVYASDRNQFIQTVGRVPLTQTPGPDPSAGAG